MSLIHKKKFGLIWQAILKFEQLFCQGCIIPLSSLNKLGQKLRATIIFGNYVNKL